MRSNIKEKDERKESNNSEKHKSKDLIKEHARQNE